MTRHPQTFRLGLALAMLSLPGCATVLSPRTCEQAAAGLNTAAQIAAVLVNAGIETNKAQKLAQLVVTGQMLLEAACQQAP